MHYFFDNCLSYRYARCLHELGKDVVALQDEMAADTTDVELFQKLSGRDVVFVTADRRQLIVAAEQYELKQCGCTALYFAPFFNNLIFWEQVSWIIKRWPKMDSFANSVDKGTIAEIKQNGKARVIHF